MSGAISAISAAGAAASVGGAGFLGTAGAALSANAGAFSLGSALLSGVGSFAQSNAAAASAGYNAQVAENNAKIATQNANFAGAQGEQNVGASEAKTRAQIGATIANQGASGVDINTGSAVDVRESEAKLGMLNTLNIRSEAARQAYGFQTQSTAFEGQAALAKSQEESSEIGGYLNAAGTVLGGIGKASQYNNYLNSRDSFGSWDQNPNGND